MKFSATIIVVFLSFCCVNDSYSQVKNPKDQIVNKELVVSKLMIGGFDRSERLGRVIITEDKWTEYDPEGNLIATAEIKKLSKKKVKVKWITAKHGAEEGATTTYLYSVTPNKILFNIKFDRKIRGFFEVPI